MWSEQKMRLERDSCLGTGRFQLPANLISPNRFSLVLVNVPVQCANACVNLRSTSLAVTTNSMPCFANHHQRTLEDNPSLF